MKQTAAMVMLVALAATLTVFGQAQSKWVHAGAGGKLQYTTDARGNRIMDFSHAGYKGGGVALPNVRVARTVKPVVGDNTPQIQAAIDEVS